MIPSHGGRRSGKARGECSNSRRPELKVVSNQPQSNKSRGEYLPWEMVTEILKRLRRGRDIARFRCVSKLWNNFLSDPTSICAILSLSSGNPSAGDDARILVRGEIFGDSSRFIYSLLDYNTLKPTSAEHPDLPSVPNKVRGSRLFPDSPSEEELGLDLSVVGCCDGIVCIVDKVDLKSSDIILWNPATAETKILPRSPFTNKLARCCHLREAIGLGFDPLTNDYKVVRNISSPGDVDSDYYGSSRSRKYGPWSVAEVYSLKNESWRRLDDSRIDLSPNPVRQPYTSRGEMLYWSEADMYNTYLGSFDMKKQVFDCAAFDNPAEGGWVADTFCLMKDCIVGVAHGHTHPLCAIWALLKFGSQKSWTKLFNIPRECPGYFRAVWKDGSFLFEANDGFNIYQPAGASISHVEAKGMGDGDLEMVAYVPSSISLSREG